MPHSIEMDNINNINNSDNSAISLWTSSISSIAEKEVANERVLHITFHKKLPFDFIDSYANKNLLCLNNTIYGGCHRIQEIVNNKQVYCSKGNENDKGFQYEWYVKPPQCDENGVIIGDANVCILPHTDSLSEREGTAFLLPPLRFHCKLTIFDITKVDTVSQEFKADLYCELRLRGIATTHESYKYVTQFLGIVKVDKAMDFLCVRDNERKDIHDSFSKPLGGDSQDHKSHFDYCYKLRQRAKIGNVMDLHDFPFDQQTLKIGVTINVPETAAILIPNKEFESVFQTSNFQLSDAYVVVDGKNVLAQPKKSDPKESSSGYIYSQIIFSVNLKRKWNYYFFNVIIPMALISLFTLVSFGLNEDGSSIDTGTRLLITLTLLLTEIAYKFAVGSSLPLLSYATWLDTYIWFCLIFIFAVAAENVFFTLGVATSLPAQRFHRSREELYVFYAYIFLFFLGNTYFLASSANILDRLKSSNHHRQSNNFPHNALHRDNHLHTQLDLVQNNNNDQKQ